MKKIIILSAAAITGLLFSCTKEKIISPPLPSPANQPPVANAGADQTITLPDNSVTLVGAGTDPDGSITAYKWTKRSGPAATITTPNQVQTTVMNLVHGIYEFLLTVTDNLGATGTDIVVVTVKKSIADAGPDQTIILPVNSVTLNGSGSQSDGNITSYLWTKISGPAATITTPNQVQTTVTNLVHGIYEFQLTVTDNLGTTGIDFVQITVLPELITIHSNWFSLDSVYGPISDNSFFQGYHTFLPALNYDYNSHRILHFVKRPSVQGTVYEKDEMTVEVSSGSQSPPFTYSVYFYSDNNVFALDGYGSSLTPYSVLLSAILLVQSYQYRVLVIPLLHYNSLNIDWSNYLEVVAALGITP